MKKIRGICSLFPIVWERESETGRERSSGESEDMDRKWKGNFHLAEQKRGEMRHMVRRGRSRRNLSQWWWKGGYSMPGCVCVYFKGFWCCLITFQLLIFLSRACNASVTEELPGPHLQVSANSCGLLFCGLATWKQAHGLCKVSNISATEMP